MPSEEMKLLTEKEILMSIRNQALVNKMNCVISLDVIAGATPVSDEHKKELAEKKAKFESDLKRFENLIETVDKRLAE